MVKLMTFILHASAIIVCVAAVKDNCPKDAKVVVCYYASWAIYRPGAGSMDINKIDPALCTHLVYTFAGLDVINNRIVSLDPWMDFAGNGGKDGYKRFVQFKESNPCLKTLIAIGGWNEKSLKYSVMAGTEDSRKEFASSVLRFLAQYEFDGIDVDWEYPTQRGGIPADKNNFVALLQELKTQLQPWGLIVTTAVAVTEDIVEQAYDIASIAKEVEYIALMAYDYTSPTSKTTGLLAPLDSDNAKDATIAKGIDLWIKGGCPANKLVLGIPMYARSYKLKDSSKTGIGAETVTNTMAGYFTREIGFLSTYELKDLLLKFKYTVHSEDKYQNIYATNGTFWITYDTVDTVKEKVKYAQNKGLRGVMAWSIDTDDFNPIIGKMKYPMLRAINEALGRKY